MTIIHQPGALQNYINLRKAEGRTVGFVPTMGALHDGHIQLVNTAAASSLVTVTSIFVNPTQFNDQADFRKYPNRLENDILLLSRSSADILFLPSVEAVYPDGMDNLEHHDLGYLEQLLEGEFRPGHFQGVSQVMVRLLNMVKPELLFMGQKDYQQCMVVKKLLPYLDFPVKLIACPTLREPDGLAMSSRNLRLLPQERHKAPAIYKTLNYLKENIAPGNLEPVKQHAKQLLEAEGLKVDYIETADADTLEIIKEWDGKQKCVVLAAAFLGEVRLIDNLVIR